jgi:hypothetical protein
LVVGPADPYPFAFSRHTSNSALPFTSGPIYAAQMCHSVDAVMARVNGFKIRTRLSYEALDNILAQYCRKTYQIILGGLDNSGNMPRKIMVLAFEDEEDRVRVKHVFAVRGALPAANNLPGAA